jgi:hypothetical protein
MLMCASSAVSLSSSCEQVSERVYGIAGKVAVRVDDRTRVDISRLSNTRLSHLDIASTHAVVQELCFQVFLELTSLPGSAEVRPHSACSSAPSVSSARRRTQGSIPSIATPGTRAPADAHTLGMPT